MKAVCNKSNSDTLNSAYFYNHEWIKCANGLKTIPREKRIVNIPQE